MEYHKDEYSVLFFKRDIPIWWALILFRMRTWLQHIMRHYRKTSNISRTLVGNKIVDNSDVVGASPVGAAPTTSSFST